MADTDLMTSDGVALTHILEAALLAADEPLSQARLASLFPEDSRPSNQAIGKALEAIAEACENRGVELREVASGFRLQVKNDLQPWVARLWTEKPQKYSRAMLETLALIAYRQPITRGEIESVRGVSLSSNIIRSLQEREWIRIVGHRDVPGKPALFGTTKVFLDYFNLKSLDELPTLAEIKDMDTLEPELEFEGRSDGDRDGRDSDDAVAAAEAAPGDEPATGEDQTDGEATAESEGEAEGAPAEPLNAMDEEAGDDDLDEAFAELDSAFVTADAVDLGEDEPEPDAGVDPDSPQGDLVAEPKQRPDES
ncbi:MAG: SMC-Scp complex subunit ScpB [Xanthomonadales bacterium]|jgi:segregation and condensation protein B|nr:SMC-Scp complex subunit ScpB [Xanthomonadales bacterium]